MPPEEGRRIRPCRSLQDLEAVAGSATTAAAAAVVVIPLTTTTIATPTTNHHHNERRSTTTLPNDNENNGTSHDATGAVGVHMMENGLYKYVEDDEEEEDDSANVLAFYDEFKVSPHHPLIRHMSISDELSVTTINEHSPLLNPLRAMPKGTSKKLWFYRAWRWYNQLIDRKPVMTKSITAGIIVALGDVTGQWMERTATAMATAAAAASDESSDPTASSLHGGDGGGYDIIRTIRFCAMGVFLQAPVTHYYYHALDVQFPPTDYPWTWTTLTKLIIDQSLFAPTFLLAVFLFLGFFEGESFHSIMEDISDVYWPTMTANWKLWIPATILNLAYVAPQYRVLYCNLIFFAWSIFLSLALNEEHDVDATCLSGC
jgi:peroxisomal membrane protein 2